MVKMKKRSDTFSSFAQLFCGGESEGSSQGRRGQGAPGRGGSGGACPGVLDPTGGPTAKKSPRKCGAEPSSRGFIPRMQRGAHAGRSRWPRLGSVWGEAAPYGEGEAGQQRAPGAQPTQQSRAAGT